MGREMKCNQYYHQMVFVILCLLMLLTEIAHATISSEKANHMKNTARCLDKKYKKCYNSKHVCPKLCHDNCTVDCRSCKPVCTSNGTSTAPPPRSDGCSPLLAPSLPPESSVGGGPSPPPPSSSPLLPPVPAPVPTPSPDSYAPPPPPPPQIPDPYAPPPPREYIPPDDTPRRGIRWCRDRAYPCYGTPMQCNTQYCPFDDCVMDCAACELTCIPPGTTPPSPPPPPVSPPPPPVHDPYSDYDFWAPARPVYPDDFPVMGTRWCRDIGADCFGDKMICDSQYCPLDQCFMDCNYCALGCRVPLLIQPPSPSSPPPPSLN